MCDMLDELINLKVDADDIDSRQGIANQLIVCTLIDDIYPDRKERLKILKAVYREAREMIEKYEAKELIKSA